MSSYSLRVLRLRLVDTAEAQDAWVVRAKRQWDGAASITLRVMCGGSVVGMTPPRAIEWDATPGLVWDRPGGAADYDPALFEMLPLGEDPSVLVEVVSLSRPPGHIVAMGTWNATPFVAGQSQHLRTFLHLYSKHSVPDPVFAVVEVEVIRSAVVPSPQVGTNPSAPPQVPLSPLPLTSSSWLKQHDIPLEFTCGSVRTSLTDLYFPPFLVDSGGSYVVSNVICVANMLEEGSLSMVLTAKGDSLAVKFHPPNGVVVLPGQRAYFSVTWSLDRAPGASLRDLDEVELLISGGAKVHPSVHFQVNMTIPKDEAVLAPFHYWVNTTCVTNRPVHPAQDLPFVRSVLPVFLFHRQAAMVNDALMGVVNADGEDRDFMIKDTDTGLVRYVAGGMAGPGALAAGAGNPLFQRTAAAASMAAYVPPIDFNDVECVGTLTLGKVVGVPVLHTSSINGSSGVAPAFKLTAQMLDPKWSFSDVEGGGGDRSSVAETVYVYQSVSGVLQWPTTFQFRKAAGACSDQFLRITLVEVSPLDDDEMPVASCLVTVPSLTVNAGYPIPIRTAFYVLDSYSLYDQLPNISLLLKGATVVLHPLKEGL